MEKISFSNKIAWQVLPNKKFAYACNLKTRQYYQFEDSAMTMWLSIADNESVYRDDLIEIVARHYEVEKDVVRDDIDEFLNSLHQEGLIDYNE